MGPLCSGFSRRLRVQPGRFFRDTLFAPSRPSCYPTSAAERQSIITGRERRYQSTDAQIAVSRRGTQSDEAGCGRVDPKHDVQRRGGQTLAIAFSGRQLLRQAIEDTDSRWKFYPLPCGWPASYLVQFCDGSSDDCWLPLLVRTAARAKRLGADEGTRFFKFRINCVPFFQICVGLESNAFFVVPSRTSGALQHPRFTEFADAQRTPLLDLLDRMQNEWQTGALRSKSAWFHIFQQTMLASPRQAAFCNALLQLQSMVYAKLGLELAFPESSLNRVHNTTVGDYRILHRIASCNPHHVGSVLKFTTSCGKDSDRPYLLAEVASLDFVCALNFDMRSQALRGFFLFPRAHLLPLLTKKDHNVPHCRRSYWAYFPEEAHRARARDVKDRVARDMEFYIDLKDSENDGDLVAKVQRILDSSWRPQQE
ncbi:unnamed protein product [Amoebophrya sp. A120]|nr:unnamed protein product [Amoebophrya sp. A120]|eukprot:GSA120T00020193001.1